MFLAQRVFIDKVLLCSASQLCLQLWALAATTLYLHQGSSQFWGRFWRMGEEIRFTYGKKGLIS